MELKDLKEQKITNTNGKKENVIKYFSLSDIYITDRSLNIGSPRNEEYFDNIEEAISKFFDRDYKNSPILKYRTDFVENIVHENTIILDENTRKLYNDSKNLEEFEKRVREKYYETNFKREYVAPTSKISKNKELYDKYINTQIKKAENFIDDLIDYDLNDKKIYDIFKTYYLYHTSVDTKKHLENFESFKDLKAAFEEEKKEFEKKYKPKDWDENDQKKLDELIFLLDEKKPNLGIESETFSMAKERILSFSEEKGKYVGKLINEIIPMEYTNVYSNYMTLCDNINYEHYNSKKTEEEISRISNILGFGDKINFEGKLREKLANKTEENFSIPITLNNKRTGDAAVFNINIELEFGHYLNISDYNLTIKRRNGEEKTMNFKWEDGVLMNAKEAIEDVNRQINIEKEKEMYAYLIDDYGFKTDISNRIRTLTEKDINSKICKQLDRHEYENEFMLNISDNKSAEGTLITNVVYIDCSGSNISEIEAPNADEIKCDECQFLEKITAPNCYEVYCENTPLLKEDNMELHPDCNIDGLKELNQLKR